MRSLLAVAAFGAALTFAVTSHAQTQSFNVTLTGPEEATPQGGDPDGTGSGVVTLNGETDTVTWNLQYANIDPVVNSHIHIGARGVDGGVVIPFGTGNPAGTPNTLSGSVVDSDVDAVLANPSNFYVNIHSTVYPAGAIRGQVPEPGALTLLGIGAAGLLARRRRCQRN